MRSAPDAFDKWLVSMKTSCVCEGACVVSLPSALSIRPLPYRQVPSLVQTCSGVTNPVSQANMTDRARSPAPPGPPGTAYAFLRIRVCACERMPNSRKVGIVRPMGQRLPRFDTRLAAAVLVAGPPVALAAFLLFVGPVAARSVPGTRPLDTLAMFLLAAAPLSLVGWRSAPVVAFGASLGWTVLFVWLGYSPGPIYLAPFAGLLVLVARSRATTWIPAAIVGAASLALARSASGWIPGIFIFVIVWLAATGLFAGGVRIRRGFQAEVEARQRYEARSQEEERRRKAAEDRLGIARDVHDVVGHSLAVISLQAGVAEHLLRSRPDEAQRAVAAIRSVSNEALEQLRTELAQLRGEDGAAPIMGAAPGLAEVPALVESLRAAGVAVELEVDNAGRPVPEVVSAACYRIVQEALTNVARHSGPGTTAKVRLEAKDDALEVEIVDDGSGSTSSNTDGQGLLGMRDRTTALGGRFEANNRPVKGFRVWAAFPMSSE